MFLQGVFATTTESELEEYRFCVLTAPRIILLLNYFLKEIQEEIAAGMTFTN